MSKWDIRNNNNKVNESVGKSLDTAKETVGTAVTGIAHDLGSVFTEKSGELDTAKNQLLERLHLGGAAGANKALEQTVASTTANHLDASALEAAARAPTPPPDLDSLKTSTPEPEIERAMANASEDTPPTPKPSIAELEKLTAEIKHTAQTTVAATVTDGAVEANKQSNAGEMSSGTTAATEPAVDVKTELMDDGANSTLSIAKINKSDSGNYTCAISDFQNFSIVVHILNGESFAELHHGAAAPTVPNAFHQQLAIQLLSLLLLLLLLHSPHHALHINSGGKRKFYVERKQLRNCGNAKCHSEGCEGKADGVEVVEETVYGVVVEFYNFTN
ncbi:unnamed protein product [Ceratitis capitata]|uniref:(Mediterranean fruit fly) hypothetical protein n=1 Tax=Ceratitis capitata TaxID=7213 RepID=A0A811UWZ1_CERCA|nr:unnamed protein product [Ceratitis capitata]